MKIPSTLSQVLSVSYRYIFPTVNKELTNWIDHANQIPNDELKKQALASIKDKTFHCEGGAIYATLAKERWREAISFVVAYQSISDYLDNLCDRSTSLDPKDFRQLHQSLLDAISLDKIGSDINYYQYRMEQDDADYLKSLVRECQGIVQQIEGYEQIYPYVYRLASLYADLQVHKHVTVSERVPRLTEWFNKENEDDQLRWYEFSAATGSTLGVFCLISYGLANQHRGEEVWKAFFPALQGLHILLDYFIDQYEDQVEGDLNFCSYYQDEQEKTNRISNFITRAKYELENLPNHRFHQLIVDGLVGLYLSDPKVKQLKSSKRSFSQILNRAGWRAKVIYWNGKAYRKFKGS
ncbi:tetraprenyl-beta-curcumene synthase family protein [Alkalibacillus aidingensis]|uniref:tetraprenyl-beta-curcumene synthase family protein n=1 Tax=Alkalibacillus aidingensis TaxID=2747607 RepID=UPI0016606702|nr:tetraprenyl-beta-curcumene synthase family protein [Alkalibacillus aidingensis]